MPDRKPDLIQGTLDLLILKTVAHGPIHGYGIAQRILVNLGGRNLLNEWPRTMPIWDRRLDTFV